MPSQQQGPSLLGLGSESLVELKDGNARLLFFTRAVRMVAYGKLRHGEMASTRADVAGRGGPT